MKKRYLIFSLCAAISIVFSGCIFSPQTQESQEQSFSEASLQSAEESSQEQVSEKASEISEVSEVSEEIKLVPLEEDIARVEDYGKKYYVNKLSDIILSSYILRQRRLRKV